MKVLFAVSNEGISEAIIKKYQQTYKEIISSKNVYYFNAIIKELQKDKSYDRIVISEDLEPFANNNYDTIDNFLFEKLDAISDEASNSQGEDIPIILISADRRAKGESILVKLFGIGIYNALIGDDRSIEQVCSLISKPRSKKDAKLYYKIASNEVGYKQENEGDVSETEIQNILAHYKRLGKNEDKYIESFDSIANQYNDEQLRLIVKFLPLNVKAVLEANSSKYQQLVAFSIGRMKNENRSTQVNTAKVGKNKKAEQAKQEPESGIKIKSIGSEKRNDRLKKPVIIPSEVTGKSVKKIATQSDRVVPKPMQNAQGQNTKEQIAQAQSKQVENMQAQNMQTQNIQAQNINSMQNQTRPEEQQKLEVKPVAPVKRGRGRPPKVVGTQPNVVAETMNKNTKNNINGAPLLNLEEMLEMAANKTEQSTQQQIESEQPNIQSQQSEQIQQSTTANVAQPPHRRGRPRKNVNTQNNLQQLSKAEEVQNTNTLPGFEEVQNTNTLPGFEEVSNTNTLPGFEEVSNTNTLPGFEEASNTNTLPGFEEVSNTNTLPGFEEVSNTNTLPGFEEVSNTNNENRIQQYNNVITGELDNILQSREKKVVGFVGTSKNGTSFLINNLAQMLSEQGIKTAILDLTENKNAYYIYTKNEEELRRIAFDCIDKLSQGIAQGIKINNNLDVYTSLPGDKNEDIDAEAALSTLARNYSLVLIDCDFKTNYNMIALMQEIYLVQSMDVLTIQPLTAYLRDLKAKNVLDPNKLRIVINKYTKVRSITEKTIIGGMAFYNDPSMSFMTELFNRETIKYVVIPFEQQTYSKYLEGLVNCSISLNGYSKEMIVNLKRLANLVYPLITDTQKYGKQNKKQKSPYENAKNYNPGMTKQTGNFSNDMNETLNKMKNNF